VSIVTGNAITTGIAGGGGAHTPTPANVVIVNAASDLPAATAGERQLVANTVYVFGASVALTDKLIIADGVSITGQNPFGPVLSTTASSLFIGGDANFNLSEINLDVPSGEVFTITDTVPGTSFVNISTVQTISCLSYGTFTDISTLIINNSNSLDGYTGVTVSGSSYTTISLVKFVMVSSSASFIGVDFGTAVSANIELDNLVTSSPAGGIGVKVAAASANLPAGAIGTITNSTLNLGGMTVPVSGYTASDVRWAFRDNSGVSNTVPDAMLSLNSNATETVISVVNTPVKVAGTWVVERVALFSGDTSGRVTSLSERGVTSPIDITATISAASGSNKDITIYLALNGSIISNSGETNKVSAGDPKNTTVFWQAVLQENDYLEVWVENNTDTQNLVAESAILRVR